MEAKALLKRVDYCIKLGTKLKPTIVGNTLQVTKPESIKFKTAGLAFIQSLYGDKDQYYWHFDKTVSDTSHLAIENGLAILKVIKDAIKNGWLGNVYQIVASELFSNFLDMAKHLLDNGYQDAAAVMIGSVLEERLRQLSSIYSVSTYIQKSGHQEPKKASLLNDDLMKAGAYGAIDHKQVTTWLGIRNSAAHAKYGDYTLDQVKLMLQGVMNFVSRVT